MNRRLSPVAALAFAATAAAAQTPYKVIGNDGRVTYTDRPPTAATDARIGALPPPTSPTGTASLPFELRQAVGRFPVTLFVGGDDCAPCVSARELLRQRGVPFAERSVQSPEDIAALERASSGREVPTLAIGAQILRGLTPSLWTSYLDAAGYPRESRLPIGWRDSPPVPLAPRPVAAASAPAADTPFTSPSLPISDGPIRF